MEYIHSPESFVGDLDVPSYRVITACDRHRIARKRCPAECPDRRAPKRKSQATERREFQWDNVPGSRKTEQHDASCACGMCLNDNRRPDGTPGKRPRRTASLLVSARILEAVSDESFRNAMAEADDRPIRSRSRSRGRRSNGDVTDCVCGSDEDTGDLMLACDRCDVWLHASCVGVEEGYEPASFVCPRCTLYSPVEADEVPGLVTPSASDDADDASWSPELARPQPVYYQHRPGTAASVRHQQQLASRLGDATLVGPSVPSAYADHGLRAALSELRYAPASGAASGVVLPPALLNEFTRQVAYAGYAAAATAGLRTAQPQVLPYYPMPSCTTPDARTSEDVVSCWLNLDEADADAHSDAHSDALSPAPGTSLTSSVASTDSLLNCSDADYASFARVLRVQ